MSNNNEWMIRNLSNFSQQSLCNTMAQKRVMLNFDFWIIYWDKNLHHIFFYSCLLAAKGFKLKLFVLQVFPVVEGLRISHSLPGSVSLQWWSFPTGAAAWTDGGLCRHHWWAILETHLEMGLFVCVCSQLLMNLEQVLRRARRTTKASLFTLLESGNTCKLESSFRNVDSTPEYEPTGFIYTLSSLTDHIFTSFSFPILFQALNHFLKCSSSEDNRALDLAIETVSLSK